MAQREPYRVQSDSDEAWSPAIVEGAQVHCTFSVRLKVCSSVVEPEADVAVNVNE